MARFLSSEWFELVSPSDPVDPLDPASIRLEQVVLGTPDGDVRYIVVVGGGAARLVPPAAATEVSGDITITCDWPTASAIAQGLLSTQRALMQGRLRVRGSTAALGGRAADLTGLDPVPPGVREHTTY